jgi:hypothetical protein
MAIYNKPMGRLGLVGGLGYVPLDYSPAPAHGYATTTQYQAGGVVVPVSDAVTYPVQVVPGIVSTPGEQATFIQSPTGGASGSPQVPAIPTGGAVAIGPETTQVAQPAALSNKWIWIGAAAVVLLAMSADKKKSSRVGAIEYEKYLLPAGLLVAGYFVLKNLGLFGSQSNEANNQALTTAVQSGTAAALSDLGKAGVRPTLNGSQLASLASDIYIRGTNSTFSAEASSEDQNYIIDDLYQLNNTADVYALKQIFGTKQASGSWFSTCALLGFNCPAYDLDAWIKAVLSAESLQNVNDLFYQKNINYSF